MGADLRNLGREQTGPITGTLQDASGSIVTGGTSQVALPASVEREYLYFQNVSDTAMWLDFEEPAVAGHPSILVPAGGTYEPKFVDRRALNVLCATTGKSYTCKWA